MSHLTQVFKIVPTIQQYDWGKLGTGSKVAVFAQSAGLADFHVDESKPYAEVSVLNMTLYDEINLVEAMDGHTPKISLADSSFSGDTG
jgi:Phosphomannose isomerase type I